jgi:hypothetical protein
MLKLLGGQRGIFINDWLDVAPYHLIQLTEMKFFSFHKIYCWLIDKNKIMEQTWAKCYKNLRL